MKKVFKQYLDALVMVTDEAFKKEYRSIHIPFSGTFVVACE
jgi:hypothetical protein